MISYFALLFFIIAEFVQEKGYYGCYMYFFKTKEFKVLEGDSCKTICYKLGEKFMTLMTDGVGCLEFGVRPTVT